MGKAKRIRKRRRTRCACGGWVRRGFRCATCKWHAEIGGWVRRGFRCATCKWHAEIKKGNHHAHQPRTP